MIRFVAFVGDVLGEAAVSVLDRVGAATALLEGSAEPSDVVFFTPTSSLSRGGRHTNMAAYRFDGEVPDEAKPSCYLVALRTRDDSGRTFGQAVLGAARCYEEWLSGSCEGVPWGMLPTGDEAKAQMDEWRQKALQARPTRVERTPGLWARQPKPKPGKQGKGHRVATSLTRRPLDFAGITLTPLHRALEVAIIANLGAFNTAVGESLSDGDLHAIYARLIKRLALVAESARTGAGQGLLAFLGSLTADDFQVREQILSQVESWLVYGMPYDQLDEAGRAEADKFEVADEQAHFARIMDVDELGTKRVVGVADAGNPHILRMVLNTARRRSDLGVRDYYPLPHGGQAEAADYRKPLAPCHVRKRYPYVIATVSASDAGLARDVMEIFRTLISQQSLEVTLVLIEEWLMAVGAQDMELSVTAAQIFAKDGGDFEVKFANVGGGSAVIRGTGEGKLIEFPHGDRKAAIGDPMFQHPHSVETIPVAKGDEIFVYPATGNLDPDTGGITGACTVVGPKKQVVHRPFAWTANDIAQGVAPLVEAVTAVRPARVELQFGHVHGDRDPDEDQVVGSRIAGILAQQLNEAVSGVKLAVRPMSDNYHVVDRLHFPSWVALLEEHSGLRVTEVNLEDALITRHLGDELIARLYQLHPSAIFAQGGNYYFRPPDVDDMVVELYDGVGLDPATSRGRQACVPFQLGYELYRLNPDWVNAAYREYVMTNFPQSMVAAWWKDDSTATYQELMLQHVYLLPCGRRMALKAQVDAEIDRPYAAKCMSGKTPMLDALLAATDVSLVALLHVLEGFYDAQERKSTTLWQTLGFPRVAQWRLTFNRHTGEMRVLDWNRKRV